MGVGWPLFPPSPGLGQTVQALSTTTHRKAQNATNWGRKSNADKCTKLQVPGAAVGWGRALFGCLRATPQFSEPHLVEGA